ncbi:hypothetical protein C5167_036730 [Papaver somniferum]|uniref:Uncharacterized protein n=1 Tax=Papaver somniferum TaxID=3469 RepID=A0A4Y7I4I3_PAPSO|nr:gibberellin-regulated protein 5-like [Papaver somniferum]KAI3868899.1 hypothetical protein MKW92_045830 [Papaver armeniacum]KAI3878975.1 hypothetical protein MKW92_032318 [Papaver armeniacum]RZC43777.1 hypothetical protein C5167_036730 [Papaver somniferum]
MAISYMVKFVALLLLALFVVSMLESTQVSAKGLKRKYGPGTVKPAQCYGRCAYRCSKTKHRFDFCMAGCMSCCKACRCVPPGTSGYRFVCACYDLKRTKKGGPKCP